MAGFEPALKGWKPRVLTVEHYTRTCRFRGHRKESKADRTAGGGVGRTRTGILGYAHFGRVSCRVLPLDDNPMFPSGRRWAAALGAAEPMGFEPTISWLTTRRPLQTGPDNAIEIVKQIVASSILAPRTNDQTIRTGQRN